MLLTGLLLLCQVHLFAQVDTIPAKKEKSESKVDTTLAKKVKAVFEADSVPSKKLSEIPVNERTASIVPDKAYFKSWLTDSRDIIISPARWNKYQWIAIGSVVGLTALLMTQDANIERVVQHNQNKVLTSASVNGLERLGSGVYSLPALAVMYTVGAIVKDDKARYTALKGVEAYVIGFLADNLMKQLTQRHRPLIDPPNPNIWAGPFSLTINSSFPSGHSTNIFAIATVIATAYTKTIWVPVLCYTLAGLTAASRVYQNDHWFSDVFVGAALGFAIGRTIMNNHIKKLKVLPISHVGTGVMLVYHID